eukprot:661812_1
MLLAFFVSCLFKILIYILTAIIDQCNSVSSHSSIEVIYFSLVFLAIILQDISNRILFHFVGCISSPFAYMMARLLTPILFYLILIIIYKDRNYFKFRTYFEPFAGRIRRHHHAAIIAFIYFVILIPKHLHDTPNEHAVHHLTIYIIKQITFVFNVLSSLFISPIIHESPLKSKPHSFIFYVLQGIPSYWLSYVRKAYSRFVAAHRNSTLFYIEIPFEYTIKLLFHNALLSTLNLIELCAMYHYAVIVRFFTDKSFILCQNWIAFGIGYVFVFKLILCTIFNGFFGDISFTVRLAVSLSVGNWILSAFVFIPMFPYLLHCIEIEIRIEILLNGFIWLIVCATNSVHLYSMRVMLLTPLSLVCLYYRYKQYRQIFAKKHKYLHVVNSSEKLKIFKLIKNARNNMIAVLYPILLPHILFKYDIPCDIMQIMLSYIVHPQDMSHMTEMPRSHLLKWTKVNTNVEQWSLLFNPHIVDLSSDSTIYIKINKPQPVCIKSSFKI